MRKLRLDIERYYQRSGDLRPVSGLRLIASGLNPRLVPNVLVRLSAFCYRHHLGLLSKLFTMLNIVIFGIEVSPRVSIGGGLFLPHTVGTVIGAESIGENVTIMQGVTLGSKEPDPGFTASIRPVSEIMC
jgi:serine O-acetyltransferase